MLKKRFKSLWNGVALFFLLSSFFFNNEIGNSIGIPLSGFTIAMIMWIFGGTVANIIFGADKPKQKRVEQSVAATTMHSTPAYDPTPYTPAPVYKPETNVLVCNGCGFSNETNALYCVECGTSLKNNTLKNNY